MTPRSTSPTSTRGSPMAPRKIAWNCRKPDPHLLAACMTSRARMAHQGAVVDTVNAKGQADLPAEGPGQRCRAEHERKVADVGADNIAEGERRLAPQSAHDIDDQLRCAGAEADDGETDDHRRYAEARGELRRATDQRGAAENQ